MFLRTIYITDMSLNYASNKDFTVEKEMINVECPGPLINNEQERKL